MSQDIAISVEHVSKIYRLYDKPVDRLKESLHPLRKKYHRDFHALADISFEVKKGETVGIIGQNGSGKSTLLKIITGVLTPTLGQVQVRGRVSALLELGTGFNPELTGIENVYFSGTVMGYTREEMDERLDAILAFADIGEFIRQPVKTYSSGMFVRLAFAVATAVEPEVLIVDEALAVGDFLFQYKCLQLFSRLQDKGTSILFVSHNTQQVIQYCNSAILLSHGSLVIQDSDVESVVFQYEEQSRNSSTSAAPHKPNLAEIDLQGLSEAKPDASLNEFRFGNGDALILSANIFSLEAGHGLESGHEATLEFVILAKRDISDFVLGFSLKDVKGVVLWGDNTLLSVPNRTGLAAGVWRYRFRFKLHLVPGEYLLFAGLADISGPERVELDQRWPVAKVSISSTRMVAEGVVYAPVKLIDICKMN